MAVKMIFSRKDKNLAAIVRALVSQAGGNDKVKGMTGDYLVTNGFLRFPLSQTQADRLRKLVQEYVPEFHRDSLTIVDE